MSEHVVCNWKKMIKFQTIYLKDKYDFSKVPNGFIKLITKNQIGKKIVSFKTDRNDVVLSRELEKVISKLDFDKSHYLILTTNLTMEGIKILKEKGIEYMTTSDYIWTDESYKSIKLI
ncbi:hypothetical protein H2O64_18170 [Kordia sp. YSTF-M3]|uniref:Uncharacterized protein n=1 Tax=Kordia aestuariivivens TaxID=2759037 RepID=A0ABR7QE53_9FLAO|nr:hypothetical protein [Kordia aestuariivivens]MBC8756604.1 hypothetical protein [Kordia aestuariivivens]